MNSEERSKRLLLAWNYCFIGLMMVTMASLWYGLLESLDDIVLLGRDLAFIIAVFFLIFKMIHFSNNADEIDKIIADLEEFYRWETKGPVQKDILAIKRWHFLIPAALMGTWLFLVILFTLIMVSTPFWVESQELPYHVAFPFELHNPSKHPIAHALIFVSHGYITLYSLIWIVFAEFLAGSIYNELTSALNVLCLELRYILTYCGRDNVLLDKEVNRLALFHQQIICAVDRSNEIFNGALTMQLVVNFLLISLAGFEAMVFRHDREVVAEYMVLIAMALGHLSCWSKFGDFLSQQSMEVAVAAYEAYDPTRGNKSVHQRLGLIILRSQKPLAITSRLLPPFNLVNNLAVLNQCYRIFTFLMQTME
ncbi:odorant receptor 65a-like [Drosophila bipectinata]|uniref:odorant receptor 65a-like n=1 Tax=Drosophila bipectinata TaxID=42026 RepID=UPI001C89194C|nr:odorant receptor 65a-like [Drosophila bipectinata]